MATLVLSIVGTVLGGPIGGAIGALAGQQVDALIFAPPGQKGPRLKELSVTTSSYGTPLPRHFGRMRVAGSVIWSTDLAEHRNRRGGGKGKPKVTTYSYTCSFAVALSSRPILGIGRIWADGTLLRGAAGDIKAGGTMRLHTGEADQLPDSLLAAAEGEANCPAYRGLAYVVFEDLDLSDFGNRIPALSFEVIADTDDLNLQDILGASPADIDAQMPLSGLSGISLEGPASDMLALLDPIFPMDCDASAERIIIRRDRLQALAPTLPEPTISVADDDFGGNDGFTFTRTPIATYPPEILRYYDIDRDFQPGLQRRISKPSRGQPQVIELPAACSAQAAQGLARQAARQAASSREAISWRTSEIDPQIAPGARVLLPDRPGLWRVADWEWRSQGVELSLVRVPAQALDTAQSGESDPGRLLPPLDLAGGPSEIKAYELPWDGIGNADSPALFAAISSASAGWSGASLFVDHGNGALVDLGIASRQRSIIGTAVTVLPPANPLLLDRTSSLMVQLIGLDMVLENQTLNMLAMGANRALLGNEIFQFANATPLGAGLWKLEGLLRGRGGTEAEVFGHLAGEPFVWLDDQPLPLDPAMLGNSALSRIAALGRNDAEPALSAIALRGSTTRPLTPVHPRAQTLANGDLRLSWTRRARGAWQWNDDVETPMVEQAETYEVEFGPIVAPLALWQLAEPQLVVPLSLLSQLATQEPTGAFRVRQRGTHALSHPLTLTTLA